MVGSGAGCVAWTGGAEGCEPGIEGTGLGEGGARVDRSTRDPLWFDLDHNLEMARLNVVAAVHGHHPDYSVEKPATVIGRGHSWLYA